MIRQILPLFMLVFVRIPSAYITNQEINNNIKSDSQKPNLRAGIQETRLGESNYFILLPDKFQISEARGKEGQLGYNIMPKDISSTMFGFIEIRHGKPIGDRSLYDGKPTEIISSTLLGKKVDWKIYKSERGYFDASTNEKGDLNASALSKNRNEIDSLVSIICTLRLK